MNITLRSYDFILTLHELAYFCSAWPSAAMLNNYTEQPLDTKSVDSSYTKFS